MSRRRNVLTVEWSIAFDESGVFEERVTFGPVLRDVDAVVNCHLVKVERKTSN